MSFPIFFHIPLRIIIAAKNQIFFFSEPVPAADARQMGSSLLTKTMARRHELSFSSYDRLFPAQDTVPKGGSGNLTSCAELQMERIRPL